MSRELFDEIDAFRRQGEFDVAYLMAVAALDAGLDPQGAAVATATIGRIEFEYERFARAAEWLGWAGRLLRADSPTTQTPTAQTPIDAGWLGALAALALARVPGQSKDARLVLGPDQRAWVGRRLGRRPPPTFSHSESWELLLAGCRAHQAACQGASPDEEDMVYQAARAYTEAVGAKVEANRDAAAVAERALAAAPVTTELCYHQAALAFTTGRLEEADGHLARLVALEGGDRHVAGLLASVQVARDLGLALVERRVRIDRAVDRLGLTFLVATSAASDPSGWATSHRIGFDGRHQRLERHRSLTYSTTNPAKAYELLLAADEARSDVASTSHARLRFLTKSNASLSHIAREVGLLLDGRGWQCIRPFVPDLDAGPSSGRPLEIARRADLGALAGVLRRCGFGDDPSQDMERALLALADTLRSLDHDAAACEWYEAMHTVLPGSGVVAGRYVSMLTTLGHLARAGAVAARHHREGGDRSELVDQERGRLELAAGDPVAAEAHLQLLTTSSRARVAIDARCGMIDAARRRRDLPAVRCRARDTRRAMADLDPALTAEADIAHGWAEVQLGVPRAGLHLLVRALRHLPYAVGGWVGVIRAMRMLGDHDEVFELLERLSGGPSRQRLAWWDDNELMVEADGCRVLVPEISLRHQPRLDNERGWAFLDLDRRREAHRWFVRSLERTPDLAQPYRGLVAACLSREQVEDAIDLAEQRLAEAVRNTAEIRRDLHVEAARTLIHIGDPRGALAHVEQMRIHQAASGAGVGISRRMLYTLAGAYLDTKDLPAAGDVLRAAAHLGARAGTDGTEAVRPDGRFDERPVIFEARRLLAGNRAGDAAALLQRTVRAREGAVSEPMRIARVVAAFEQRDFDSAGKLVDEIGGPPVVPGEDPPPTWTAVLPVSEIQLLLRAWILLARSELPAVSRREKQRLVADAEAALARSDESSIEELHLRAILEARRVALGLGGSRAAAEQYLTLAIERRPHDGGLVRDLGAVRLSFGQLEQAAIDLEEAHRRHPHDARVALLRGAVCHSGGDIGAALQHFCTAVALDPSDYVHHRALAVALLEGGRTDDALRAVQAGIDMVRTQRDVRLRLLQARVHAERAAEMDRSGRDAELRRAEIVLAAITNASSNKERAELLARRAYIAARRDNRRAARQLLNRARALDCTSEDVKHLQVQLDDNNERPGRWAKLSTYSLAGLGAMFSLVLYLVMLWRVVFKPEQVSLDGVMIMIGLAAGLPLVALATPRIRSLKLFQVAVELDEATPFQEAVHIDLDLSASDLLRVSGFSNHRPNVPFDDVEARELES